MHVMLMPHKRTKENFFRLGTKLTLTLRRGFGLKRLIPLWALFYVAVFDTTENRDKAKQAVSNTHLYDEDEQSGLITENFGNDAENTLWRIDCAGAIQPKLTSAIEKALKAHDPAATLPSVAVRHMEIDGIGTGRYYLRFEGKMMWLGKQLDVGSCKRLVGSIWRENRRRQTGHAQQAVTASWLSQMDVFRFS